jgi:hypothetical protein
MNVEVGDGIYGSQRRHDFHEMLCSSDISKHINID